LSHSVSTPGVLLFRPAARDEGADYRPIYSRATFWDKKRNWRATGVVRPLLNSNVKGGQLAALLLRMKFAVISAGDREI
jgi:hypothetical protein